MRSRSVLYIQYNKDRQIHYAFKHLSVTNIDVCKIYNSPIGLEYVGQVVCS